MYCLKNKDLFLTVLISNETILALVDSGGTNTFINSDIIAPHKHIYNIRQIAKGESCNTGNGELSLTEQVDVDFVLPQFCNHVISHEMYIMTTSSKYGMIIGRDILKRLKIDLCFSNNTFVMNGKVIPMEIDMNIIRQQCNLNNGLIHLLTPPSSVFTFSEQSDNLQMIRDWQRNNKNPAFDKNEYFALIDKILPITEEEENNWAHL